MKTIRKIPMFSFKQCFFICCRYHGGTVFISFTLNIKLIQNVLLWLLCIMLQNFDLLTYMSYPILPSITIPVNNTQTQAVHTACYEHLVVFTHSSELPLRYSDPDKNHTFYTRKKELEVFKRASPLMDANVFEFKQL